jgi:putative glutamine amidotransferase
MARPPVVGIPCNRRAENDGGFEQRVDEATVIAVRDGAQALPLLIPALDSALDVDALVAAADGFLFGGAVSNVAPRLYGAAALPGLPHDAARDSLSLPLIRAAVAAGKPVFCICRGVQELNVALGGTLHQAVHALPGRLDHREDPQSRLERQFGPAHDVGVVPGGLLAAIAPSLRFTVNSLHGQGIDAVAPGLVPEALAPDGQIEAVSLPAAKGFVLGVQWHPEWRWAEDAVSRALFAAFAHALPR